MANKSSGKKYTSQGERCSVSLATRKAMRRERTPAKHQENIIKAWRAGTNPWVTIDNPDKNRTDKRQIRVRANELFGDPKKRFMSTNPNE
jgi:hypothetical protein